MSIESINTEKSRHEWANMVNKPLWVEKAGLPVQNDEMLLLSALEIPLSYNSPNKFYDPTKEGGKYWQMKKKYITFPDHDPDGKFEVLSSRHPEFYAARVYAWLASIGEVTTDEQTTSSNMEKMNSRIIQQKPIRFAMTYSLQKFPLSSSEEDIKTAVTTPDLAEVGLLHSLGSINEAIKAVYPPGVQFRVLNEAKPFSFFPSVYSIEELDKFRETFGIMIKILGLEGIVIVGDLQEECNKNPSFSDSVANKYQEYYKEMQNCGLENPFIKAETRNIYLPGLLETGVDEDTLLRIYSASGFSPLQGMSGSWDPTTKGDAYIWKLILAQARIQAAYFRAYLDTRNDFGGVYEPDEVAVTVTENGDKITLPTGSVKAQEVLTHWSGGIKIFPSAGTGVLTKFGIGTLPSCMAIKQASGVKYSQNLDLYYLSQI